MMVCICVQDRIEQARAEQLHIRQERMKAGQEERDRRLQYQRLEREQAEREKEALAQQVKQALETRSYHQKLPQDPHDKAEQVFTPS